MLLRLIQTCGLVVFAALAHADEIRVDPPFWWQGFEHTGLQLMLSGDRVAEFTIELNHPGIDIVEIAPGDSPNYLFVYLDVDSDAELDVVSISLTNGREHVEIDYEFKARDTNSRLRRGFSTEDAIYLVMPDRFANGDPENDAVSDLGDAPDRDDAYGRHGGDIEGLRRHLDYIADLGFTALWLNPVMENAMPQYSYHGYAITDHYRIDPRLGTNEDYRVFVQEAGERGVGVIMDMVENHIGRGHPWLDDPPTSDWLNSPNDYRETNHARTANQDPYASAYDQAGMADGWFTPDMPDLNQRNRHLAEYLIQNAIWWVEYAGLIGIRQDTWPYPDKHFMVDWATRILAEYPDLNIVGEEWSEEPPIVAYWQAGKNNHDGYVSALPSLFDFPLQSALADALTAEPKPWGSVWTSVYETLSLDHLYPDPFNLVTFVDNHDMSRLYTVLGDDDRRLRMALTFIAAMRGIPQIFYGTEVNMTHPGTDSHGAIRGDFPGGWAGDRVNAFTGQNLSARDSGMQAFVRRLFNWRKSARVVHHGRLMQFAPKRQLYAFARYDEDELVLAAFNRGDEPAILEAERYAEVLGGRRIATDVLTGRRVDIGEHLEVPPMSSVLLEVSGTSESYAPTRD